jgi:hypothetical protein
MGVRLGDTYFMPKKRTESVEVGGGEPCPCESGKTYGRCCKRRLFQWHRDSAGEILRVVKLGDETLEAIERNLQEFEETFGRKPRKNDRLFFQSYSISERDIDRQAISAMKSAGINPLHAYVYRKTQRIVRDIKLLTPDELKEHKAVCQEFYDSVEAGADPYVLGYPDTVDDHLLEEMAKTHIVGGYFIDNHFNRYRRVSREVDDVETVAAALSINFVRSLKSVHVLLKNDISYDAYNLLRSMYENYLSLKYVYRYPSEASAFLAQLGVELGTHEYAVSRSGDPVQSRIIEKSSGALIEFPSRWRMALKLDNIDREMYKELYRSFSSFSHSDMSNIAIFLKDGRFDYHNQGFTLDAAIKCNLLILLMFSCLEQNSTCRVYLRRDLKFLCRRTFVSILGAVKFLEEVEQLKLPEIGWSILKVTAETDERLDRFLGLILEEWDENAVFAV